MKEVIKKTYWLTKTEATYLRQCYGARDLSIKLNINISYLNEMLNRTRPVSEKYAKKFMKLLKDLL